MAVAGRDPPRAQALGYRFLAEARRRDETQRRACESFREAHRFLSQGGSPYAAVAAERIVYKCLYPSQLDAARAELARLDSAAEPRAHLFLLARTRWLQGLIAVTQGDLTGGLDRYRLARDGFVALGDAQNQAFVHTLMAEALTLLGDGRRAWEERRSALALLDRVQDPRRVQGILEDAALACLDARLPRAALDLLTALVESGLLNASPALLSDALTRRSTVRHALSEDQLAVRDLSEARRRLLRIEDGALSDRMRAEVDAAEGVLFASTQPERAVDALQRAADYFARAGPVRVPSLRLQTARVQSARGLVDSAEEDLLAGIHLIEAQRVSLTTSRCRPRSSSRPCRSTTTWSRFSSTSATIRSRRSRSSSAGGGGSSSTRWPPQRRGNGPGSPTSPRRRSSRAHCSATCRKALLSSTTSAWTAGSSRGSSLATTFALSSSRSPRPRSSDS